MSSQLKGTQAKTGHAVAIDAGNCNFLTTFLILFMKTPTTHICRPKLALQAIAKQYPNAWKQVDELRARRGKDLENWPNWCFLPLAGCFAIIENQSTFSSNNSGEIEPDSSTTSLVSPHPLDLISPELLDSLHPTWALDTLRLGALSAWRVTQGIYRFDPVVLEEVLATTIEGDIPCDILYRIPEWCIYIETPGYSMFEVDVHGIWAHLEWDVNTTQSKLNVQIDTDGPLRAIIFHLGPWTIADSIKKYIEVAEANGFQSSTMFSYLLTNEIERQVQPLFSLIIYICSQASEVTNGDQKPLNPTPVLIKGQPRLFPPKKVTTWDVGVRLGAALRNAMRVSQADSGGHHNGPRGHIRRAHWHGFRTGPMKDADGKEVPTSMRKFELRWMPPVAVNLEDLDSLPATIRSVN